VLPGAHLGYERQLQWFGLVQRQHLKADTAKFILVERRKVQCCLNRTAMNIEGENMEMLQAVLAGLALVGTAVIIHYESLRAITILTSHLTTLSLVVIAGVLLAHLLEICIFAAGYFLMHEHLGLGSVAGAFSGSTLDYFYFSATTYTTLGVGDLFPTGAIRSVAAVEALSGFVLIGWSASFTYLSMQRSWDQAQSQFASR
jgi:Ion channel